MSFENVQLPTTLIADLYRQSLVIVDDVQPAVEKPKKKVASAPPEISDNKKNEPVPNEVLNSAPPGVTETKVQYTGGFGKQVSVVIADQQHKEIAPAELDFLQKMMTACKLSMDDIAIINVEHNQPAAKQLWQIMPAKAVLMFGVNSGDIGIPFYRPDFQVQNWSGAFFMGAPPLSTFIGPDTPELKLLKRELWEGLQKVFLGK